MRTPDMYRWAQAFPAVYWHTSVPLLKKSADFYRAKSGSLQAACAVVARCAKDSVHRQIRLKYPGAVLLVLAAENMLPTALAQAVGLEWRTCAMLGPDAWSGDGLLGRPQLAPVPPRRYILVDDIIVQGGSLCALHKHVIGCGGTVEAVVALACTFDGESRMPSLYGRQDPGRPGRGQGRQKPNEFATAGQSA